MNQVAELPGLDRVRLRFLEALDERQAQIARHARAAGMADTAFDINDNLEAARHILHQIAGTAGSLGYAALGTAARTCEHAIIAHLEGPDAKLATSPKVTIRRLDFFVSECRRTLRRAR